jgi:hypothetical protein
MSKRFKMEYDLTLKDIIQILVLATIISIIVGVSTYISLKYENAIFYVTGCGILIYGYFLLKAYKKQKFKIFLFETFIILILSYMAVSLQNISEDKSIVRVIIENNVQKNVNENTLSRKSIFQTKDQKHKYTYGTIEEKIIILKSLGLTKEQVYNKLKNNTDFRTLLKNNDKQFNLIYDKPLKTKD